MSSSTRPFSRNQTAPNSRPIIDGSEAWYTDVGTPSNRMVLSLRSGLSEETTWSLDRLLRLSNHDSFSLGFYPGLTDALFDWPMWFIREGHLHSASSNVFAVPKDLSRKRKYAMDCMAILRNAVLMDQCIADIIRHPNTLPLVENALLKLDPLKNSNTEFLILLLDFFHAIGPSVVLPQVLPNNNYLFTLQCIVDESPNRSLIIAAFSVLNLLLANALNTHHVLSARKSLNAAIRYLPLFVDAELVDACVSHIYAHLSVMSTAKDFLMRRDMPSILRLLVGIILNQQVDNVQGFTIPTAYQTRPDAALAWPTHELTPNEMNKLAAMHEPQRCHEWTRIMFEPQEDGEVTQVEFWNMYRDAFERRQDEHPMLAAQEVIKSVNAVYPTAQAMVVPETLNSPQRFIVRGVVRRKDPPGAERFACQWERSQCSSPQCSSSEDLYRHLIEHISTQEEPELHCLWANCPVGPFPHAALKAHVRTHVSPPQPARNPPSQSTEITVRPDDPFPLKDPTTRGIPPPRDLTVSWPVASREPNSTALTALLSIRILFRASFTMTDPSPKADENHFGFPGIPEDDEGPSISSDTLQQEREAQKRGQKAFSCVKSLMENVRIQDDILQSWIQEMMDVFTME